MGQTDLKPTAQGQVESSINDTINFIMAKVAAGEIDAATATELIAAARKDYESNVPVTTSAQQAVQPQQTANPYQADPQTAYAVPEMEPEQTPIDYGQFATSTNYPHTYDVEDSSDVDMDALTDEIYIIDRAGEYTGISSRYGGVTYNFAVDSDTYLNPFDTVSVESLSPDAQLAFKIDAMLAQAGASAAEAGRDLGEEDQSIITRCVQEAFFDARQRGEQPPLLEDFYNKLLEQAFSYHVNKITNAQDTRGRGLKPLPKGFDRLYSEYKNGDISARSAATKLGITHPTFLKYVKECDVRLHKDDLVQTHNPRGLTERHAAATDAARNLNHDQDAPDSPLRDR